MNFTVLDWFKENSAAFPAAIIGAIVLGVVAKPEFIWVNCVGLVFLVVGAFYMGAATQRLKVSGGTEIKENGEREHHAKFAA